MNDDVVNLEDLFENAPCGYLLLAQDGRIIRVNRTFCEWTGFASSELIGKRLRDLLNVAGKMFYETHFAPLLRMQGFFDEVALDVVKADGKKLPMLANAREKRDAEGYLEFTRITAFRATQRRRYERDLVDARDQSDASNRELRRGLRTERQTAELREQFIAVLGHDLRNPLASISAGTNLLMRGDHDDKTKQVLRLMLGSISRMGALIDNVLDFARGRLGGGLSLNIEADKSLQTALELVIEEIRTSFPERKIEVDFQIQEPVDADHARIAQLFSNLLGNAVAHGDPQSPIQITAQVTGGIFELAVSNGGEPISPNAIEQLFQPFYRGKVKPNTKGLGLGLYIASEIAKAHAGRIDVTSSVDQTSFTFRMPVSRES